MPPDHPHRPGRRAALAAAGAGAMLLARRSVAQSGESPPACVLTPAQTEGPYFVDERLDRTDIRSDPGDGSTKPGALLLLQLRVSALDRGRCAPLAGAIVDVWHCDATGVYSDVDDMSLGTKGSRFLRGYQATDATGRVRFTTIYPGAYAGRAVHIHFKIRSAAAARGRDFTSQLYFDDALTDRVHAQPPYAGARRPRTRNERDMIYRAGGSRLQLDVASTPEGFAATYEIGIRSA